MSRVLLAAAAAAALSAPTLHTPAQAAEPAATVPSERITVDINTVNGSGCPAGTAAVAVSADNTAFTVTYSDYLAQAGPGAGPTDFRRNCQLNLDVRVPHGFTYAVAAVDYRGYAHLARGATGLQKAQYYFQGQAETHQSTHEFTGPYDGNWQTRDTAEVGELVWAPCGEQRNFNINTELRVGTDQPSALHSTNFIAMDSTDGSVNTVYRIVWKECEA